MGTFSAYPYSRGHIHITGPEVGDPLDFNVGFFSDVGDVDIKKHVWGYKKGRELMRRTALYRGEVATLHPPFPAHSKAAIRTIHDTDEEIRHGFLSLTIEDVKEAEKNGENNLGGNTEKMLAGIKDLEYSAEDDRILEQFLRENISTTWHSLGTAKMAPREQKGVVDSDLSVYGVTGLKIADLSIAPENVAANTNNTALMIGEKAADIIIRELGLGRPI
jgi:alcohol oxidase